MDNKIMSITKVLDKYADNNWVAFCMGMFILLLLGGSALYIEIVLLNYFSV